LIQPVIKGDAFVDQVRQSRDQSGLRIWWLGQSGFLLQHRGHHALVDPYLSDSLTQKYAQTDKPHVRMTELLVQPERLDFIDVVSSSHNHTDHLDSHTLVPLMAANPQITVIVPRANLGFAADRLEVAPDRLTTVDVGGSVEAGGYTFHALPAAHDDLETDQNGFHKYVGYVIESDGVRVYHSGDTMMYEGMLERLKPMGVDVALLPINGKREHRRVAGNLWGREAAQLGSDIGAGIVVPCHYEMFEFNTESPDEFVMTCEQIGQRYRVLKCGEMLQVA